MGLSSKWADQPSGPILNEIRSVRWFHLLCSPWVCDACGCVAMALGFRRSFKITVHAKICNLYIKLKATLKPPSGKLQRLLKLDKLLIGADSKSESWILVQRRRTLKSRMLSFVKKHLGCGRSKMPHAESENQSWDVGRMELRCVAFFGVGLGYLLALNTHIGLTNAIHPSFSSTIWVCLCLLLFVLWLHKCKYLYLWAILFLIALLPLFLLQLDKFVHLLHLRHFL
ncbi:uncharacterized protein LOC120092221 [Benincasa hispida]|uniref:uncharacterized protein LOC120092221 n=1 Tax=Benincasa hispida TaxID=102211 RepID=UPI0018FF2C84|nr:uncharacterized protein LOC120092221 [Benincasa hispida]